MMTLTETETFAAQLARLPDAGERARILAQLNRLRHDLPQRSKSVTTHVSVLCLTTQQVYYARASAGHIVLLYLSQTTQDSADLADTLTIAEQMTV